MIETLSPEGTYGNGLKAEADCFKECRINLVGLVHYNQSWNGTEIQFNQNTADCIHFSLYIEIGSVHDMEKRIGIGKLFQCSFESGDKIGRKISDETDGIGNDYISLAREPKPAVFASYGATVWR